MALSNWDTLALDESGRPTNGVFTSPLGIVVEIYKNWLYVRDSKGWESGGGYVEPTIMEIQHGSLSYKDVQISAIRGPKNGVYCVVQSAVYPTPIAGVCPTCQAKKGGWHGVKCPSFVRVKHLVMVGIGCYGYSESGDWLGVEAADKQLLYEWIHKSLEEPLEAVDVAAQIVDSLKTDGK